MRARAVERTPRHLSFDKQHPSREIPNLLISASSSLLTSGRGQPTMTIQALAFRPGEQIARFASAAGLTGVCFLEHP